MNFYYDKLNRVTSLERQFIFKGERGAHRGTLARHSCRVNAKRGRQCVHHSPQNERFWKCCCATRRQHSRYFSFSILIYFYPLGVFSFENQN